MKDLLLLYKGSWKKALKDLWECRFKKYYGPLPEWAVDRWKASLGEYKPYWWIPLTLRQWSPTQDRFPFFVPLVLATISHLTSLRQHLPPDFHLVYQAYYRRGYHRRYGHLPQTILEILAYHTTRAGIATTKFLKLWKPPSHLENLFMVVKWTMGILPSSPLEEWFFYGSRTGGKGTNFAGGGNDGGERSWPVYPRRRPH